MVDDKLNRFFNSINFNEDFLEYFNNASLKEVLLDRKKCQMTLIIEMENLIPLEIFDELCKKGKNFKKLVDNEKRLC